MKSLEKVSQDACALALKRHGFTAKRRGILLQAGGDTSVTGWLGLNLASWDMPNSLKINPVVGVRHVQLEAILVSTAGWTPPLACVSRPLGYLMPQRTFIQWDFLPTGDLAAVAADLAAAVAAHGQPFIDHWSNWETFARDLGDSDLLMEHTRFILLPAVAALDGDHQRARQLLDEELKRTADREDAYATAYREFTRKFTEIVMP